MISVNAEAEETKSGYLGRKEKYKRSRRDAQPFGRRVIKNLKKKNSDICAPAIRNGKSLLGIILLENRLRLQARHAP